jgi:hypothetical protein
MSSALSSPSSTRCGPVSRSGSCARSLSGVSRIRDRDVASIVTSSLGSYQDQGGRTRELLALPGHAGSVLVVDRDATTLCDRRLVAHLDADEPRENAALVCRHYIEDPDGRWCRNVRPEDLQAAPFDRVLAQGGWADPDATDSRVADQSGSFYRLCGSSSGDLVPQLLWHRCSAEGDDFGWEPVRLRDVIAKLESYEPIRELTERAVGCNRRDPRFVVARLRCELSRLCASPIVLNRGLREAVLLTIDRGDLSMSEIASRCGVVKRDRRGKVSGETSWLARRIGIMPEGGKQAATPWIHSEVLAVIAREGLGISPREVEIQ